MTDGPLGTRLCAGHSRGKAHEATMETSARTSVALRPQLHGGALNTGNPGNAGGGRTPDAFKAMCRELVTREQTLAAVDEILRDKSHPLFMSALNWATNHGYGKAKESLEVSGRGGAPLDHVWRFGDIEIPF
jgi:hypothetical protein